MQSKLSTLREAFEAGNFRKAVAIAARFPNLGKQRNAILDAHTAFTNPRWVVGLGKNVDKCISDGVEALRIRYGFVRN